MCAVCEQSLTSTSQPGLLGLCRTCISELDLVERHTIDQAAQLRQAAFMMKYTGTVSRSARPRPQPMRALARLLGHPLSWGKSA